ncbi:hypothetical protein LTR08_009203 [Meristemomyces frigidus]|nr:hypothetical protein LTR08_009203 [Meristemomyces frigidus]
MDNSPDDDADLKLVKASATLLSDLEDALPKLLWRASKDGTGTGRVHARVKRKDLDNVLKLIEPFQGEPQLLDARLKYIVPPIVEAYLQYLQLDSDGPPKDHMDLQAAVCIILYTLCKVRGYKVIVGFFNNEPRYFESILTALERTVASEGDEENPTEWQVPYVLLLWVSHLLLTPFDLASISAVQAHEDHTGGVSTPQDLPSLAFRVLRVGMGYLSMSTKAQDAAAAMLVRLVIRPDIQKLGLADSVVARALDRVQGDALNVSVTIYERLGPLRLLTGIATSADLSHLTPVIYRACEKLAATEHSSTMGNAVAEKLVVKIFRNIAILCLRSASANGPLRSFLEKAEVLETVIDHLLRSLGDRDTPVRFAAAKAVSLVILELGPGMGHEVIQAVLDTFKEDMPREGSGLDFRTANALRWHGLTLALAHALFKRTASPEQLPDIVDALVSALQFEQRTATGSSVGTNVRDAANFGIWSMSRRYTTDELLAVDTSTLRCASQTSEQTSVIQTIASQLILSACLDPAGNIRRGSSAALQELIGRHPNEIYEGISLVQIVEYQAVGLRRRAMINVVQRAADMHHMYWEALLDGLLGWRGLGSADVSSREASADSISRLSFLQHAGLSSSMLDNLAKRLGRCLPSEAEALQGLLLALACTVESALSSESIPISRTEDTTMWVVTRGRDVICGLPEYLTTFSPRILRSELPAAAARFVTALCRSELAVANNHAAPSGLPLDHIETLLERLLSRHEDTVTQTVPALVRTALALKRQAGAHLGCLGAQTLCTKVAADGSKSTLQGAGRAIALGALAISYDKGLAGEKAAAAISTLTGLMNAMNVDWRVIGVKALQLAVDNVDAGQLLDQRIVNSITDAMTRGMSDYTIDERGDVGSLVRLQAISCASSILGNQAFLNASDASSILGAELARLSLEKLDRVRMAAAQCRWLHLGSQSPVTDVTSVSTYDYFYASLQALRTNVRSPNLEAALLEGCVSCAGVSTEPLLHASRSALVRTLYDIDETLLHTHVASFAALLKRMLTDRGNNIYPALELLGFLLDMQIPQRMKDTSFKWRNLLSTVQKSHHKSNDIPTIVAAVHVYCGLADVASIRNEVLKKLISMLKTNPYPRVRMSVAEALFLIVRDERMGVQNWAVSIAETRSLVTQLEQSYTTS